MSPESGVECVPCSAQRTLSVIVTGHYHASRCVMEAGLEKVCKSGVPGSMFICTSSQLCNTK